MGGWSQFFHENFCEKAHAANGNIIPMKFQKINNINKVHVELGLQLGVIMRATGKAKNLKLTDMFKTCEDCASGKAKNTGVNKLLVKR